MKRRVVKKVGLVLGIMAGVVGIGTTSAYFSDYEKVNNQAAVGRNETEIVEDFPDPTPTPTENGKEYKKIVQISNDSEEGTANVDCYVRALVTFSNFDIGQAVTLTGLDTEHWIYDHTDGYYYYKDVLKKGSTTTPLFRGFEVNTEQVDTQYLSEWKDFQINIYEESVQKGDFEDYKAAWKYYLNPIRNS